MFWYKICVYVMNCIKQIDKIMHKTDSETKSFPLYKLDKISVAILYLVVDIVKNNFESSSHQNTREVDDSSPLPLVHIDAQDL